MHDSALVAKLSSEAEAALEARAVVSLLDIAAILPILPRYCSIVDLEDSIAAVDAENKTAAYSNGSG